MENIEVDPKTVAFPFLSIYDMAFDESRLSRLVRTIRAQDGSWRGIPTVAVCALLPEIIESHRKYPQIAMERFLILGDGLHRRVAALTLKCQLPCTLYSPEESVDMSLHGLKNFPLKESNSWYDKYIGNYLHELKYYKKEWNRREKEN